jgi:hypothetical protein
MQTALHLATWLAGKLFLAGCPPEPNIILYSCILKKIIICNVGAIFLKKIFAKHLTSPITYAIICE